MSHAVLKAEALQLPAEQRAELADLLLDSLHSADARSIEQAWVRESEDRLAAYRQGAIPLVEAETVLARLRSSNT